MPRTSRAIAPLIVVACALGALPASALPPASINGIGLVDYSRRPTFKVGDWAKYHMTSKSELGVTDDYTVTVLIAGEEDFWGDPAFWIETWVEAAGHPPEAYASLMSYEIFADTSAIERLQMYMRKAITMLNEDGTPRIDINKPATGIMKARRDVKNPVRWDRDTLGVDTVQTPKGTFRAVKVLLKQGKGVTQAVGDSSVYTEVRENRTTWYVDDVPITHIAREDIESIDARKTWLVGRSGDAQTLNIRDRGLGTARLVDYGHGLTARMVPERLRHSIAEQVAAERAAARPRPIAAGKSTAGKPRR